MGGGDFEQAAIGLCGQSVDAAGDDMEDTPGGEIDGLEGIFRHAGFKQAMSRLDDHRFFFNAVVLHAEAFPRFNEQDLADVILGFCPEDFVAPRFYGFFTQGYQFFG